ncbi:hypothetical protein Agabi119p4_4316 [Agaricus bisporus var. burnettii]|uniref:Fungal lipase-type domain-containing protein n=1 Tax=Agaricus bisporus var. burnettii TaxID=192524 RepID=A0A8H7KHA0_AGABI|nr:hypothetical protein Agabi119p4_4316 [Agaricus bisporus var. burnettii]
MNTRLGETEDSKSKEVDQGLVLVIFIHGFKGTDETFGEFPKRLQHILSETIKNVQVESIIFPAYETKGELNEAVIRFADWLTTLTVERENKLGRGAGSAKIVLCGHSMGGFLAADSVLEFVKTLPDKDCPLWPNIIACVTFDTPFLGINPAVVKNGVTKATEYASTATTIGSAIFAGLGAKKVADTRSTSSNTSAATSSWGSWGSAALTFGGTLLAGAAVGGAYYQRNSLNQGFSSLMDHMKYVGNAWYEPGLRSRIDALVDAQENHHIIFHNFYVHLPESPPTHLTPRTFIVQPKRTSRAWKHFSAAKNKRASDEIQGHTTMFNGRANDGYYNLGLDTAKIIQQAAHVGREDSKTGENSLIRAVVRSPT